MKHPSIPLGCLELPSWQPTAEQGHLMSSRAGLPWGLGVSMDVEGRTLEHCPLPSPSSPSLPLIPEGGFPPLQSRASTVLDAVSPSRPLCSLSVPSFADCCVHCILSCLFCEFLTLCNIVLDCATCGSCTSEDSCICCCCCNSGECADCDLPCDMDCGIIDACCESADCLEICMECCGLCFSS